MMVEAARYRELWSYVVYVVYVVYIRKNEGIRIHIEREHSLSGTNEPSLQQHIPFFCFLVFVESVIK